MNSLNLTKVSEHMTAKERAKLVISLQLKGMNSYSWEEWMKFQRGELEIGLLPTHYDIKQLVSGCPRDQANEYNFLVGLKQQVWTEVLNDMRDEAVYLDVIEGKMAKTMMLFGLGSFFHYAVRELERVPIVVGKEEYDNAVVQTREEERQEELSLEGRYNLAEQEAYYRLIKEGKLEEGGDLDGYLDYIANFAMSEEELAEKKLVEIKEGKAKYELRKARLGGDDEPLMNFYSKYDGLSDEEIKIKIKENYFTGVPDEVEHQRWVESVKQERNRLLEAVKTGELTAKGDGILAGSYYDWKGRHQKFGGEDGVKDRAWNPLQEDCMEIGYSGGKIVSASKAGNDWHQLVAVTIHNRDNMGFGGEDVGRKRIESIAEMLKKFVPFELAQGDYKKEERTFRISDESHRERLVSSVKKAANSIQNIYNNLALIEMVEDKYFDGMEMVNRELGKPFSTAPYLERAKMFIEDHNKEMRNIEISFNRTSMGLWDYKLEGMDAYLLSSDIKSKPEWVQKALVKVENAARE